MRKITKWEENKMKNRIITQFIPRPGWCSSGGQKMKRAEIFHFDGIEALVPADMRCFADDHLHTVPVRKVETGFKWGFHFAPRAARESILKDGLKPSMICDIPESDISYSRERSVYFYTTPVVELMQHLGDLMTHGAEYDVWLFDISEAQIVGDEWIRNAYHHMHVDGECVNRRTAVRTLDYELCKPISYIEVPAGMVRQYAMNGYDYEAEDEG